MATTTASPASMPPIKPSVEAFVPLPPILSVNDDVLREIIFRSMRADGDRYASRGVLGNLGSNVFGRAHELYKLIRICRRFRDIAYANPDFWADIVGFAPSEKGFAQLLQRACNVPLTLVRSFERPLSKTQIEFLLNNLDRIAILCAHNSADNDWTATLSGQTMDSLVALSIDSKSVVNEDSSQISIPPLNAPHLHHLKFTGSFYIPVIAPRLRGLELSGTRTLMSPVELLDMLLSTPALQGLYLYGILPSAVTSRDQWDHCSGREVHLHCLETLDLSTDSCATVVMVLRHVKLPAKASVNTSALWRSNFRN
ncbi:hypothetical protein PENSPDRAFT_101387 [Peniophora sp. CONT]|nr:hypothetical protein PENSPDRAFT_101387 [Peniophora sp. CONT]